MYEGCKKKTKDRTTAPGIDCLHHTAVRSSLGDGRFVSHFVFDSFIAVFGLFVHSDGMPFNTALCAYLSLYRSRRRFVCGYIFEKRIRG